MRTFQGNTIEINVFTQWRNAELQINVSNNFLVEKLGQNESICETYALLLFFF